MRRLPVYLLIDTSASMAGDAIEAMKQGIKALISDLKGDPQALETIFISLLTFNSYACQLNPLVELMSFQEPEFEAGGVTSLGAGLSLLMECMQREVISANTNHKGDWQPVVFIFLDGDPTDEWESVADNFRKQKLGNVVVCLTRNDNTDGMKRISDNVVKLSSLQPDDLKQYLKWVSTSVRSSVSQGLSALKPPQSEVIP